MTASGYSASPPVGRRPIPQFRYVQTPPGLMRNNYNYTFNYPSLTLWTPPFTFRARQGTIQVTGAFASSTIRAGIWEATDDYGNPGELIFESAPLDSSSTGLKTFTAPQVLTFNAGEYYWQAVVANSDNVSVSVVEAISPFNSFQGTNYRNYQAASSSQMPTPLVSYPSVYQPSSSSYGYGDQGNNPNCAAIQWTALEVLG